MENWEPPQKHFVLPEYYAAVLLWLGADPADPGHLLIWGASRPSCAVIVTEDSSVIMQKGNQLSSSAARGSVGGFHL